ncbi:methylated-DNA--[protein]-cysteine S-methyltransferase [Pandoraea commovens]|uniref:Methylated-DNA--protein-cysteine methyltransferase n=1 Tax=Pandoraea commovens TaxID=2508289 RepID=A0A5E4VY49_9BURK|nr:methylated-DNA--[protein]-cysteine S-methyltransferase [Pandoraea commovens]UVA81397.1 methylated-DNA--[protein]-cysteine S-methyltransferase [Pandoraea commovens]VVE16456.1 cysteine methyltransferase [Pandoraea commovens]
MTRTTTRTTTHYEAFYDSPLGEMLLVANGDALTGVYFNQQKYFPGDGATRRDGTGIKVLDAAKEQLNEYFHDGRRLFELDLAPDGTPFQKSVWDELRRIPFGETRSYGDLAHSLGDANKSRAVGAANGRNPITLIVPCHRVIGADGTLTGYASGVERKLALLSLEGAALAPVIGASAATTRHTRLSAPANLAFDF